jgi:UDP-3-O-[3-hydroxymyristoyl] glucosamine N-acyltransferase
MLNAHTVEGRHGDVFTYLHGNREAAATDCHMPCDAGPGSLVFVSDQAQLATARERGAAILVVQRDIAAQLAATETAFGCCFSVRTVSMGMAVLLKYFDRKRERFTQWGERHPTAIVIGDGCCIGSHAVVENDARLGPNTLLHPHVFVGAGCELGRDCEVHPHASIGSDGFGYAVGPSRRPQKLSHLGNVCIGDEVEIGSNCAIDRATLSSTHIRSGTKLDNICHIAHNCDLGEDGFYTAGFMMAGSTKIGRRFMTGGNSVVSAHLTLADDVVLAGRSTVTSDVPESGNYGGYPLQPMKDFMRTLAALGQLTEIRRNLNRVLKHLQLPERP